MSALAIVLLSSAVGLGLWTAPCGPFAWGFAFPYTRHFWRWPFVWVWNVSEALRVPLGRAAPVVFGLALGARGRKVER